MTRHRAVLVVAVLLVSVLVASAQSTVGAPVASGFVALAPARLLDTRPGESTTDEFGAGGGAVGAGDTISMHVAGRGGVPATGVAAVALNVTAVDATVDTYVSVFRSGAARPATSSLNPSGTGHAIPNMVIVPLSTSGDVDLYNHAGSVQLIADVAGYFPVGSSYTAVSPARLLDTRACQPVGAGETIDVTVVGAAGVPTNGTVGTVLVNVTAVDATQDSFITVFPSGKRRPLASSLNPSPGSTSSTLVAATVGADGRVSFFNATGSVHLVVDVVGWIAAGDPFTAMVPARLLDTRFGEHTVDGQHAGVGPVGATTLEHRAINLRVVGRAGVPLDADTVVLSVTAVNPTRRGYVTVWAAGTDRPLASNLNTVPGTISTNLVLARVSAAGDIALFNSAGTVDLVVDIVGFFVRPPVALSVEPDDVPAPTPVPAAPGNVWLDSTSAPLDQDVPSPLPSVALPAPGVAAVVAGSTPRQVGTLPVWVSLADPTATPIEIEAEVYPQRVAEAAGAQVLLVSVGSTGAITTDTDVVVEFDYSMFRDRFGGDWADRLAIDEFDSCSLNGRDGSCPNPTPVASVNDETIDRIRFDMTISSVSAAGGGFGSSRPQRVAAGPAGDGGAFGLVADAAGSTGNFAASPLSPSASWSAGGGSGGFSWSYPLVMPASPGGGGPSLSVGYSSQAVDGINSDVSAQAGQLGLGWDLSAGGFIERRYVSCTDPQIGGAVADNCWAGWNASIVLNGVSSELIPIDADHTQWRPKQDNGWRIESRSGAPGGDVDGLRDQFGTYWLVTDPGGVRYTFGRGREGDTDLPTSSVWTVPVISARAGEPCFELPNRMCQLGWRWNLDRVEDPNGNVTSYVWQPEFNQYGARGDAYHPVQYVRGGVLAAVAWTKRAGDEAAVAPARLDVVTEQRCVFLVDTCPAPDHDSAAGYPDVPVDLLCAAAPCRQYSPTFFTTLRVKQVVTSVWEHGVYRPVDAFTFTHELISADPADGPKLWLRSIQRTGLRGGALNLPAVRFESFNSLLANRADSDRSRGVSPILLFRVDTVRDELGGETRVTYGQPHGCDRGPSWATNASNCYPAWWTPKRGAPGFVAWNKYVVTSVVQGALSSDSTFTESRYVGPPVTTTYRYLDAPAWHHDDRPGVSKRPQSWGDWRGYGIVQTVVGDPASPAPDSVSETRYHRGMDGDRSTATMTRSVSVTASVGLSAASPAYTAVDSPALRGMAYENRTFDGAVEVSGSITEYREILSTPGTDGGIFEADEHVARMTLPYRTTSRSATGSDPLAAVTTTETDFDAATGLPVTVFEAGDGPSNQRCTRTAYTGTVDPSTRVWDRVVSTTVFAGDCLSTTVAAQSASTYDVAGNPLTSTVDTGAGVIVTSIGYGGDVYGRPTSSTDGNGNVTRVRYLENPTSGFLTDVEGTNALGQTVTIRVDAARGSTLETVNARGFRSRSFYDPLGRMTGGQSPREAVDNRMTVEYRYLFDRPAQPEPSTRPAVSNALDGYLHDLNSVETRSLLQAAGDPGNATGADVYTYAYVYIDGLGRTVETQTASPIGARIVADTLFDDRGLSARAVDPYHDPGQAGSAPRVGLLAEITAHEMRTAFDGAGRPTTITELSAGLADAVTALRYSARSTTTTPPGGAASTSTVDAFGRTIRTVTAGLAPTVTTYDVRDLPTVIATGLTAIRNDYDLAGRRTSTSAPDAGVWTFGYDANGNQTALRDAEGHTTTTVYDPLNRPTQRLADLALSAAWAYDAPGHTGLLTSATSYQADGQYSTTISAYDELNRITAQTVSLPGGVTSTTGQTFDRAGHVRTTTMGDVGPAATEVVTSGFDDLGLPTTLTGASNYLTSTGYDGRARIVSRTFGGHGIRRDYTYDIRNRIATIVETVNGTVHVDDHWTYDPAGNVTAINAAADGQRQCFTLDVQFRLVRAFSTASAADCSTPDLTAGVTGTAYDTGWSYSADGNIDNVRDTDGSVRTYSYGAQPHATVDTVDATFSYDRNGNRTGPGTPKVASHLIPITPVRLADTRDGTGGTAIAQITPTAPLDVPIFGRTDITIPADATAVVVAVTGVTAFAGALVVYPAGSAAPAVGQVLMPDPPTAGGESITANLVTVPVDATGHIFVGATVTADAAVDIVGFYQPVTGPVADGRYVAVTPTRAYDSRADTPGNPFTPVSKRTIDLSAVLPADAVGVVASVTVTDITHTGFFTISPAGQYPGLTTPATSTINADRVAESVSNQVEVMVALTPGREVDVFANGGGDVILDIVGYITGPTSPVSTDGVFIALPSQQRLGDFIHTGLNETTTVSVATHGGVPADATGLVANVTLTSTLPGFATTSPTGSARPIVSMVSSNGGDVAASAHTVTRLGTGGSVDVFTNAPGTVTVDAIGYYTNTLPPAPVIDVPHLQWDAERRLVRATTAVGEETYSYAGDGSRLAKHRGDVSTYYLGDTEITTTATVVTMVRRYYRTGSTVIAVREITATSNTVTWLGADVQGSQNVSVSNNGIVSKQYYTPYGVSRGGDEKPTEHGHLGQVEDTLTALTYLNARYYDPRSNVFISVDPLVQQTGDPYLYAGASPTTLTDPLGLCAVTSGMHSYDDGTGDCDNPNNRENRRPSVDANKPPTSGAGPKPKSPKEVYSVGWYLVPDNHGGAVDWMTKLQSNPSAYFPFKVELESCPNVCGKPIALGNILHLSGQYDIGSVEVVEVTSTSFTFLSLPDHVLAAGGTVTFSMSDKQYSDGADVYLSVSATEAASGVEASVPGPVTKIAAKFTWSGMVAAIKCEYAYIGQEQYRRC